MKNNIEQLEENILCGDFDEDMLYEYNYEIRLDQHKQDIEKACEWISNNYNKYVSFGLDGEITFHNWKKDFIKAMEEEL